MPLLDCVRALSAMPVRPAVGRLWWVFAILSTACGEDFPNAPASTLNIQLQPGSADTVAVRDTTVLALHIEDAVGDTITGIQVSWESSDPAILSLETLPAAPSPEGELTGQVSIRAIAHARGEAVVTAVINGEGVKRAEIEHTVTVMERWLAITAGVSHTCAIAADSSAYCWGAGLIGNGTAVGSAIPSRVIGELRFSSISAGDGFTCGTLRDGRAYCWGKNDFGTLGNSLTSDALTPVAVSLGQTFTSVSAGQNHVCGVAGGKGFCWGDNLSWQLGDGGIIDGGPVPPFDECKPLIPRPCSLTPRPVRDREFDQVDLLAIGPGLTHTCAILSSGDPICWGSGTAELGRTSFTVTDINALAAFLDVAGEVKFATITAGASHNCGLTASGSLAYCWGLTSRGELGTTSTGLECPSGGQNVACSPTPLPVPDGHAFSRLSVGEHSTCGIADAAAYCWGSNQFGQLGIADAPDTCTAGVDCSLRPVRLSLPGDPGIASIAVGSRHGCAVTASGAAYCWGEPDGGKLGNASVPSGTTPVGPSRVSEPQ